MGLDIKIPIGLVLDALMNAGYTPANNFRIYRTFATSPADPGSPNGFVRRLWFPTIGNGH